MVGDFSLEINLFHDEEIRVQSWGRLKCRFRGGGFAAL